MSSNDTLDQIKQKKRYVTTAIQIGIGFGEGIVQAIRRFTDRIRNSGGRANTLKKAYQELKGIRFTNEAEFVLAQKRVGNSGFVHTAVSNDELKEFEKLCKEYGVDYLFQKRPKNLEELFDKRMRGAALTKREEKVLDAFTIVDNDGNQMLKPDAALITFSENDLDIVDMVVTRMEENTYNKQHRADVANTIAGRMQRAKTQIEERNAKKEQIQDTGDRYDWQSRFTDSKDKDKPAGDKAKEPSSGKDAISKATDTPKIEVPKIEKMIEPQR